MKKQPYSPNGILADARAGIMIFIVALPLFMGIAVAVGAPVFSGVISGIIGGLMVALLGGTTKESADLQPGWSQLWRQLFLIWGSIRSW